MNIKKELKNIYVNENKKTVVALWKDGTKTFAQCSPDDNFSTECGVLICYLKKTCGNSGFYGLMGDLMEKVKIQNKNKKENETEKNQKYRMTWDEIFQMLVEDEIFQTLIEDGRVRF